MQRLLEQTHALESVGWIRLEENELSSLTGIIIITWKRSQLDFEKSLMCRNTRIVQVYISRRMAVRQTVLFIVTKD